MDSFAFLQNHLAICGIEIPPKLSKIQPFNEKNLSICIVLCFNASLNAILLNEANTVNE